MIALVVGINALAVGYIIGWCVRDMRKAVRPLRVGYGDRVVVVWGESTWPLTLTAIEVDRDGHVNAQLDSADLYLRDEPGGTQ